MISDIKLALEPPGLVQPSQRGVYLLKMGKVQYDLQNYHEAIETLQKYLNEYPLDENNFQGHLLLAMCYHEGKQDLARFCEHAEKVLQLKPDFSDQSRLRLNLFSVYLQLFKQDSTPAYKDQAADHLYVVMKLRQDQIKPENQLWLANHYYQKVKPHANEYLVEILGSPDMIDTARHSRDIYEMVLGISGKKAISQIHPEILYMEQEIFKLGNIYGWLGQTEEQAVLLKELIDQQNSNPSWGWTLRQRALFSLANVQNLQGQIQEALTNYQKLASGTKIWGCHCDKWCETSMGAFDICFLARGQTKY